MSTSRPRFFQKPRLRAMKVWMSEPSATQGSVKRTLVNGWATARPGRPARIEPPAAVVTTAQREYPRNSRRLIRVITVLLRRRIPVVASGSGGDDFGDQRRVRFVHHTFAKREVRTDALREAQLDPTGVAHGPVTTLEADDRDVRDAAGRQRPDLAVEPEQHGGIRRHHADDFAERNAQGEQLAHRLVEIEGRGKPLAVAPGAALRGRDDVGRVGLDALDRVAVQIGAERERHDAGLENDPRLLDAEMDAPADVDPDAAHDGLGDDRMDFARGGDERAGMPRERMGQD